MRCIFLANIMLNNIKPLYLHCVFHGIRFKVNNEDWLSVMDSLYLIICVWICYFVENMLLYFFGYPERIASKAPNPNK